MTGPRYIRGARRDLKTLRRAGWRDLKTGHGVPVEYVRPLGGLAGGTYLDAIAKRHTVSGEIAIDQGSHGTLSAVWVPFVVLKWRQNPERFY